MKAPESIIKLVERFDRYRDTYVRDEYKETRVRVEFIDPFFEGLGWDVRNTEGKSELTKDVVHEAAFQVRGKTRAPDYSFRIGGRRKFFLEAKKPSVDLRGGVSPAFQLRLYAWNMKLPLSLLTDFEEFAIYDARVKPLSGDKADTARIQYFSFEDYIDQFAYIHGLLSRDSVLQGSLDQYILDEGVKRGTSEVDVEFLEEIEGWRDSLARNIALRNTELSVAELNFAVQRTIDRILFLRIAEDRGIEEYKRLWSSSQNPEIYRNLIRLFRQADDRYNAGIFDLQADDLTPGLAIDDSALKPIIERIYPPLSSYEFSVFPADVLGQVYEQFLGKVIRLTPAHRAKIEEKPEVKKAGGVFYTPTYVVDFIVDQTVGEAVDGKTPRQLSRLRILDPACGSGSFLLAAYQRLLDYHHEYYRDHGPENYAEKRRPQMYQDSSGDWKLTTSEKKRILLNNIYGVDIDRQAVEVTKLSLLLKVLEGETDETLGQQLKLWREQALPNLGNNIKCGNSLIGSDYFRGQQLPNKSELRRVNPFDWPIEFPGVFKGGGFGVVIGNPPWGGDIDRDLDYFHAKYPTTTKDHTDSFKLFIEAALRCGKGGALVSMIVPNTLIRQRRIRDVREHLLQFRITSLIDLGEEVFRGVVAPSCIFVVDKRPVSSSHNVSIRNLGRLPNSEKGSALNDADVQGQDVEQRTFEKNADMEFMTPLPKYAVPVVALGDVPELRCKDAGINYQRINVGMQEKGKSDLSKRLLYSGNRKKASDKMYWKGADINRYWIANETDRFCRTNYKDFIRQNEVVRLNEQVYDVTPKILLRQTADHVIATIDYQGIWFGRSVIAIVQTQKPEYDLEYILALLNSRYFRWLYHKLVQETGRVFAQVKLSKIKQLPIRLPELDDPDDIARHSKLVELVKRMLELSVNLHDSNIPSDRELYQRQVNATERQIDFIVYELYGLNDDFIAAIEEEMG